MTTLNYSVQNTVGPFWIRKRITLTSKCWMDTSSTLTSRKHHLIETIPPLNNNKAHPTPKSTLLHLVKYHITKMYKDMSDSDCTYHLRTLAKGKETGRGPCAPSNCVRTVSCVTSKCDPISYFAVGLLHPLTFSANVNQWISISS